MDVEALVDREQVTDLLTRYTRAIDTGAWDLLDGVFTSDAEIDYTESGGIAGRYPEVKAWLAETLPAFFPRRMHMLGQLDITVGEDAGSVTAYFHNPMQMVDGRGGTTVVELGGLYHHELVRVGDEWRSRRLREELVWKRGL